MANNDEKKGARKGVGMYVMKRKNTTFDYKVIVHAQRQTHTFICTELFCFKGSTTGSSTWQLHVLLYSSLWSFDKHVLYMHMFHNNTDSTSLIAKASIIIGYQFTMGSIFTTFSITKFL